MIYSNKANSQEKHSNVGSASILNSIAPTHTKLWEFIRRMEMQDIQEDHGRFGHRAYQEEWSPI
jgi:hypothetical protein